MTDATGVVLISAAMTRTPYRALAYKRAVHELGAQNWATPLTRAARIGRSNAGRGVQQEDKQRNAFTDTIAGDRPRAGNGHDEKQAT